MVDVTLWENPKAKAAFEAKGRELLDGLLPSLAGQSGVIAIEPESGEFFLGQTLGKANAAAAEKYRDQWLYYARLESPDSAIALASW